MGGHGDCLGVAERPHVSEWSILSAGRFRAAVPGGGLLCLQSSVAPRRSGAGSALAPQREHLPKFCTPGASLASPWRRPDTQTPRWDAD